MQRRRQKFGLTIVPSNHNFLRPFHREHGGLQGQGKRRNEGTKSSEGEYILSLSADVAWQKHPLEQAGSTKSV